jgi:hypothetical protein
VRRGWRTGARISTVLALLATAPLFAELPVDRVPAQEPAPTTQPTPATFTRLVEHEDTLELVNVSDRPIVAWMVRTVTRSSQGHEAKTGTGVDAFRDELLPTGTTSGTLPPGQSVTIEKPRPWLREDHRGPGSGVRHYVGLVAFDDGQVVGDADLIERLFERRRDLAAQAAAALDALERDPTKLRDLPMYSDVLTYFEDEQRAIAEIRRRAQEDYRLTVDHLRPQDLAILERERERAEHERDNR